jgi:hypothetical protein
MCYWFFFIKKRNVGRTRGTHTGDTDATPITFRLLLFIIKGLGKFSSFEKCNLRELRPEKWKRRTKRGGKCAKNRIKNLKFRRERKCNYGKSPYT